jgi:putative peptidoglycan lipid II flippase
LWPTQNNRKNYYRPKGQRNQQQMIKKIFLKQQNSVVSAAMVVAFFGLVSRVLGLLRDRFLAARFGAGEELDIYFAAFKIPDFVYNVFIWGAVSAVLIPIFLDILHQDKERAMKFLNLVLNDFLWIAIGLAFVLIIFTPQLMLLISPGFGPEKMERAITLARIMLLSPLLLGVSNILSSLLQAFKRFFVYSLSPVFYNLGIIAGIFFFVPSFGVKGLAFGVVLGAMLHLLIQLPAVRHLGFSYKAVFSLKDPELKKASRLIIPRSMAIISSQVNSVIIVSIASFLSAGSIAIINFANNLQSVAIGLFGIPFSIAVFPVLSSLFAQKKEEEFSSNFTRTLKRVLFLTVPVGFTFVLLRAQIVRLVLGSGQFDWSDTKLTAAVLGLFSATVFFQSIVPLFLRGFYSIQNTKTPFWINISCDALNILSALLFIRLFRYSQFSDLFRQIMKLEGVRDVSILALPLSFSLVSIVNVAVLYTFFKKHILIQDRKGLFAYFYKIFFFSAVGYFVMFWSLRLPVRLFELDTFFAVLIQAVFAVCVGAVVYFALCFAANIGEAKELAGAILKLNKKIFSRAEIDESIPRQE